MAEQLDLAPKCHSAFADAVVYIQQYQGTLLGLTHAGPPNELETMNDLSGLALPCLRLGRLFVFDRDNGRLTVYSPGDYQLTRMATWLQISLIT